MSDRPAKSWTCPDGVVATQKDSLDTYRNVCWDRRGLTPGPATDTSDPNVNPGQAYVFPRISTPYGSPPTTMNDLEKLLENGLNTKDLYQ